MTLSSDAYSVAEWLVSNHAGQKFDPSNAQQIANIAQVLADFRDEGKPITGITEDQSKLLKFYREFQGKHGHTPSYAEAGAGLGFCKSKIFNLLHQLEERGVVMIPATRARAVTILARV